MRLSVLLPLLLAACGSIAPSTMMQMQSLDPLTVDPAVIEVAALLPPGLAITPGTARLELHAARGTQRIDESFVLAPRDVAGITPPAEGQLAAFGLTSDGVAQMRAVQSAVAAWPAEGRGQATFGVGVDGCTIAGPLPPTAEGAILIRLEQDGTFLTLVPQTPIIALIGAEAMARMRPCTP